MSGMSILNHRDYRSARAQLAQIVRAIGADGLIADITSHLPPDVAAARQQALRAERERLEAELAAYEKLRGVVENEVASELQIDDLGLLPIVGRISRRLSQRELAERLDLKEQQIQRYERERYNGISLARYQRTLEVLGIELHPRLGPWEGSDSQPIAVPEPSHMPADVLREIRKRGWVTMPPGSSRDDEAPACRALYR